MKYRAMAFVWVGGGGGIPHIIYIWFILEQDKRSAWDLNLYNIYLVLPSCACSQMSGLKVFKHVSWEDWRIYLFYPWVKFQNNIEKTSKGRSIAYNGRLITTKCSTVFLSTIRDMKNCKDAADNRHVHIQRFWFA